MTSNNHNAGKATLSPEDQIREDAANKAAQIAHDKAAQNTEVTIKSSAVKNFFNGMGRTSLVALASVAGIAIGAAGTVMVQKRLAARNETPMEPTNDGHEVHFETH